MNKSFLLIIFIFNFTINYCCAQMFQINSSNFDSLILSKTFNWETDSLFIVNLEKEWDEITLSYSNRQTKEKPIEALKYKGYIESNYIPSGNPIKTKTARITSFYGMRKHPIYKKKIKHKGLDISCPKGTNVHSTADGFVMFASYSRTYGKWIKIYHNDEYSTIYAHLSNINIKEGQKIRKGDIIGTVGNSGISNGYHLHYEIILNNKKIDPFPYINRK